MDLWKNKVAAKFKLLLGGKRAAAEANKYLDESKAEISKDLEEKRDELKPKVIGIYEASSPEIKTLIKEPNVAGFKKHSTKVHKLLEELVTIDFPGSKAVSEATGKYGPVLVSGSVIFVFEKVSTFIVTEERPIVTTTTREVEIPLPAETTTTITTEVPPATEVPPVSTATPTTIVPPPATTEVPPVTTTEVVVVEKMVKVEPEKVVVVTEITAKEAPAKVEAAKPEEAPKAK